MCRLVGFHTPLQQHILVGLMPPGPRSQAQAWTDLCLEHQCQNPRFLKKTPVLCVIVSYRLEHLLTMRFYEKLILIIALRHIVITEGVVLWQLPGSEIMERLPHEQREELECSHTLQQKRTASTMRNVQSVSKSSRLVMKWHGWNVSAASIAHVSTHGSLTIPVDALFTSMTALAIEEAHPGFSL